MTKVMVASRNSAKAPKEIMTARMNKRASLKLKEKDKGRV